MSETSQDTPLRDTHLVSRTTVSMSPIFFGNQSLQQISLLSPLEVSTKQGPYQQYHTLLTIDTYSCALTHHTDAQVEYEQERVSPKDRDYYYDQDTSYSPGLSHTVDTSKLPIPTYNESQMAYHPNGVKKLPHFHPQKFSKRLRTIISQRRRPQPLSLYIEPQPKSYFSLSLTPCQTSPSPDSLIQSILRVLSHRYGQANQVENVSEEYDEDRSFWGNLDHRVIILGVVGLMLLAFGLGAWMMALYTA
ncbi:hypothetical protein EV426DRAFT_425851 [Tirmania nivea]|nr:hypothetical protein EV426DRAFT_425851 [Tirmania nivea]